jgi:hypothetical protein
MAAATIVLAALACPQFVTADPVQVDLIGYGRISMVLHPDAGGGGAAVFTCEDPAHADRLLTKLRADFTWDDRLGLRPLVLPGGVSAWVLERSGVLVLAESW